MMSCRSELQGVVVKGVDGDAFKRRGRLVWLGGEGGGGGTPRAAEPFVVRAVSMFNVLVAGRPGRALLLCRPQHVFEG